MLTGFQSRRVQFFPALLLLLGLVVFAEAIAAEQKYPPVRAPMIPGVRAISRADRKRRARPVLKEVGGDWLFAADLCSEMGNGASNYAAALGNGRLSVALSPWADLVVFRWPSPIDSDHLRYFTFANTGSPSRWKPVRMQNNAPSPDWKKYGHPFEPCPELGSRAGLLLSSGEIVWLGDPSWTSSRAFVPEDSTALVTTLTRPSAVVEVTDWVLPDQDLMVRRFRLPAAAQRFFYHTTFAPVLSDTAEVTAIDPPDAGFAAFFLPAEQVMLHFQPRVKSAERLAGLPPASLTPAQIDAAFPEAGVFVAWGLAESVSGFQVGADPCRRTAPADAPLSGRKDAADGTLSGNSGWVGFVDAALAAEVTGAETEVSVLMAAADSAAGAVAMIQQARAQGVPSLLFRAVSHWQAVSQRIQLPAGADGITRRVARRSVLNLLQGQDQESGAIVASISRQPRYNYDWPRDGSFFDLTLDLAGFPEAVTRHHAFYARTQYTRERAFAIAWLVNYRSPWFRPAGHWPPNLDTTGKSRMDFLTNPFEIDETALLIWDFWRHERLLPETEHAEYIRRMQPTLERAVDALLEWVDWKKAWTKPAIEDDSFPPEATLHGVASVATALAAACDAAPRWGIAPEKSRRWCEAASLLCRGARARLTDPEVLEHSGWRGLAWSLWPAPFFTDYQEPAAAVIKERLARRIEAKLKRDTAGFAYLGEEVFTLALADQAQGEYRALLERALVFLTHEVAFPGTDCYGEVTVWVDLNGEKFAQQRTSIPHLWNGVTVYLSALALYEPERFEMMRPPVPAGAD